MASSHLPADNHQTYRIREDGGVTYTGTYQAAEPVQQTVEGGKVLTASATDAYLEKKLSAPSWAGDPSLARSKKRADEAGVPDIAVSAMQGQFLGVLAKGMGASRILEIGTLWGYSTVFLARALPSHGMLDTLELSPLHAQIAQQTFLDADVYPFPKIHIGSAIDTLKKLTPPGEEMGLRPGDENLGYDLVFIDADKERILQYFEESLRLTRKGGIIIVDNAIRGGRVADPENNHEVRDVRGLQRLFDWVEKDNGKTVLMSGIQTVGAKSWDGFAMAVKL